MNKLTVIRTVSPVEPFYRTEVSPSKATDVAVKYVNDVSLVFNQQRLDKTTLGRFTEMLNKAPGNSVLQSVRKKMTDSQLHQFVKSRYCQSMSELQAWAKYLDIKLQDEAASVKKAQSDIAAAGTADTTPAGTSAPAE